MAQEQPFDAIVIGSGLGGLACAAYLAAAGRRTLVLESHYVAGGNSQVFRRRHTGAGLRVRRRPALHRRVRSRGAITRILRGVGLAERVVFRPLDPDGFTTLVFPDLTFRVPRGWDRYRARLLETFPDEAGALGRVVDVHARGGRGGAAAPERASSPRPTLWPRRRPAAAPMGASTGDRAVRRARPLGAGARRAARRAGRLRGAARRARRSRSHAGLTDHYMRGAFYPEGGGQVIAARLVEAIRAYGGEVRTRSPVARVRVEGGRVARRRARGRGEAIDAPVVVSNADLKRTVLELVGDEHFTPARRSSACAAYRMSLPLFIVYLAVDELDLVARGCPNTNYFLWGTLRHRRPLRRPRARQPARRAARVRLRRVAQGPDEPASGAAPATTNLQIMTLVPREYALLARRAPGDVEGGALPPRPRVPAA